jgi:hypothetical protein
MVVSSDIESPVVYLAEPENALPKKRRIAYANERFATAGPPPVPGWESARRRTYILLGPPDDIEQHPSWQAWLYRNFDHSSDSLILTFQYAVAV